MTVYLAYFIFIFLSGFIVKSNKALARNKKNVWTYFSLVAVALILIAGLRGEHVGNDTLQYSNIWDNLIAGNYNSIDTNAEVGYYYLQTFFKQFIDYQEFLVVMGIFSIIPISWIIYKYSSIWSYTFLMFYSSMMFFTFEFAAARQCLAFTFVAFAFHNLMTRDLKKYMLFMFVAFFFHQSSIIFVPCYWLYCLHINKKFIMLWCSALVACFVAGHFLFAYLNSFSRIDYSTSDVETGGQRLFLVLVSFVFLGFINKDRINSNDTLRMSFILFSISPVLWPMLTSNPALYRLQYYFDFFLCLYIPNLIYALPQNSMMKKAVYCYSFAFILYVLFFAGTNVAYYPYKFFWE